MPEASTLFDLAAVRIILLHDRGRQYTITCNAPSPEDWRAYFAAIRITSEQQGTQRINTMDIDTPRSLLAERVIVGAAGYRVQGLDHITQAADWQKLLPLAHRRQVGATLADVRVSGENDSEYDIVLHGEEVSLDATFGAVDGKMVKFTGLKHFLKTPSAAQFKRYNDAASRSIVVGGSRSGRTIYTGAQAALCELYDELVMSVEGYRFNYDPVSTREQAIEHMDLHHKFIAAQEVFNPASTVSTEAEAE